MRGRETPRKRQVKKEEEEKGVEKKKGKEKEKEKPEDKGKEKEIEKEKEEKDNEEKEKKKKRRGGKKPWGGKVVVWSLSQLKRFFNLFFIFYINIILFLGTLTFYFPFLSVPLPSLGKVVLKDCMYSDVRIRDATPNHEYIRETLKDRSTGL